jgi:hypothetical protein
MTHTSCGQLWAAQQGQAPRLATLVELHLVRSPTNVFLNLLPYRRQWERLSMESDRRVSGATAEVIQKAFWVEFGADSCEHHRGSRKSTDLKEAATLRALS